MSLISGGIRLLLVAGLLFLCESGVAQGYKTHEIELGPEINQIFLPVHPVGSVQYQPAIGALIAINLRKSFGIDSSISITPTSPISATSLAGGRLTQFFAGGRAGLSKGRLRIYGKFRPGIVSFGSAITRVGPPPQFQFFLGRLTAPAFDFGGITEIGISRRFAARYEAGDTIIRYAGRNLFFGDPPTSPEITHNFEFGIGFMFLFH